MILISAGHYPQKPGACFGDFCEHEEAAKWADLITAILTEDKAIRVPSMTLDYKVNFINMHNPVLAVEIHFNSAKQWKDMNNNGLVDEGEMFHVGSGCETLYYPGSKKGKQAAEVIQAAISGIFTPDRGVKEGWYGMNPANGPDYFLKRTKCTSLIIEPEFIDRKSKIITNRKKACEAIAEALLKITGDNSSEREIESVD